MSDYAKKKNDELMALCKERGLAHTGKKADLVKRLEEHDAQSGSANAAAAAAAPEDEIDWDEDTTDAAAAAKAATTEPAANTSSNTQAAPSQEAATTSEATTQPASTTDAPAAAPAEKKPEVDFSTGLAARTLDEEIEKRKARARKFGLPEDTEEIKALERAKRFGTATTELPGLGLLNGALPEKRERKGRGGGEAPANTDGGIRKNGRERQRGAKGKVRGAEKPKSAGAAAGEGGQYPGWMTQKDREAAERRRAKFSSASS
jgi:SAP domain-containing ribonucleoprotein